MIKTILITGLDGSGKSTLFSKLEAAQLDHVTLITLPHVDAQTLPDISPLKHPIQLLNAMSQEADENHWSDLKALALFCSMVLFNQLVKEQTTTATRYIICERHPLIDTFVYAQFYLPRLSSGGMKPEQIGYYNTKYEALFSFILEQLPVGKNDTGAIAMFTFIKTFFAGKTSPDEDTANLFHASVPNHIFFLKADPEILMERISSRKVMEPHEKVGVLSHFNTAYDTLFKTIAQDHQTTIENIDAASFDNLNAFYTRLTTEIIT
ncbi:hypothetical protein [Dokdonia sp.]|uniref:hypothetical protein n=1 Tax=Dokdonia sp. TaxID=2024995 RepID=UPI003267D088